MLGYDGGEVGSRSLITQLTSFKDLPLRANVFSRLSPMCSCMVGFAIIGSVAIAVARSVVPSQEQLSVHLVGIDLALDTANPAPSKRCGHVIQRTVLHNVGKTLTTLKKQFELQSSDPNMFYRGYAYLFWEDFVSRG